MIVVNSSTNLRYSCSVVRDITYAFFNYTGTGTTDNVIVTDSITFLYTETDGVGNGIKIENAFPKSDDLGKVSTKSNEYFDFKITSKTASTIAIPYEVTARKSSDSDNIDEYVRIYLTKGVSNQQILLDDYSNLTQTKNVLQDKYTEKTIYTGKVPANETNYEETFRLRMWLSDEARFDTQDLNNKTFKLTVNVYSNAEVVSENEPLTLTQAILNKYPVVEDEPTLTTTSAEANENGLYKSTLTNSGKPTYYFRGNVENYIDFAGFTWRVVRINEDGTIRIIMQNGIDDDAYYVFNSVITSKDNMYYTNSDIAKPTLEDWYDEKIASNPNYSNRVATGEYYCEQAKIAYNDTYASDSGANMIVYNAYDTPDFECKPDLNGHGLVNASVGLLSYDEVLHAGGYYDKSNNDYYLYIGKGFWTMSPAGGDIDSDAGAWIVYTIGDMSVSKIVSTGRRLRPVINLKADTIITGTGDSDNHWVVSNYKEESDNGPLALTEAISNKYPVAEEKATLTTTSAEANENGLYKSTLTNSGNPTYYFRGNVENYIDFAGFTWRVVRINEDGTIRIVMQNGINNTEYAINSVNSNKDYMYYSNSDTAKPTLETWYNDKIASNTNYLNRVVTGKYYCEQAKVVLHDDYATNSGTNMTLYSNYTNPNFECTTDANGKGLVNASVGLLSYDEVLHAGGYYDKGNNSYYLYNGTYFWTMSPAGFTGSEALEWFVRDAGGITCNGYVDFDYYLRPVLNLKADTVVTGTGDSDNHWVVALN